MTLRVRLAAVSGVAVAVAVIATAVFTYIAVRSSLRGEVDQSLEKRADGLADIGNGPGPVPAPGEGQGEAAPPPRNFRPGAPGRERLRPDRDGGSRFGGAEGYAQFILPTGQVIGPPGTQTSLPAGARARALARAGEGSFLADKNVGGTHLRILTQAAPGGGAVQVARPLDEIDDQLRSILIALIVVGAAGIAFGAGLGAVVARTALLPIGRFTRRTETLGAHGDLSQRMEVVGHDELARLALSFNSNLDALERSVEAQRHLVADASHELRTPIASLRANIQMLQDADRLPEDERARMRDDIVEELDELTALVGDVVELARGAKPADTQDDVRLDQLVSDLVERARRRVGESLAFDSELEPVVVRGEPERMGRAISNLLGNAAKWSPPGGRVEVRLADGVLSVRDHGPGFKEQDLPHVFERFYRSAAARGTSGSGLGLAIVEQAAESHGGFAEAANAPGGGALMRLSFGPGTPAPGATATGAQIAPARTRR